MFQRLSAMIFLATLVGCATQPEREAVEPAVQERIIYEGVFAVPDADLSDYTGLQVLALGMDDSRASIRPDIGVSLPGQLTEADRQFYRTHYSEAVVSYLVADGTYDMRVDAGPQVLQLMSELVFLPPQPADNGDPRRATPAALLLNMEVYDSQSQQLLLTITERYFLGSNWARASGSVRNMQVRMAFAQWLGLLRRELDILSDRADS